MLRKTGIYIILGVIAVFLALHFASIPDTQTNPRITIATAIGGVAFLCMTMVVILTTRLRFLENWFGGLDRMYQVHRFMGIATGIIVLIHWVSAPEELPEGTDLLLNSIFPSKPLGIAAMLLLVIGIFVALNQKITYSRWRPVHKFMALVYILAIAHFKTTPPVFVAQSTPDVLMLTLFAVLGLGAAIYTLFAMGKRTAMDFTVEKVVPLERATEVTLKPTSEKLNFHPGQFAFVEIIGDDWGEPHPFTISSAPSEDNLRFTMKVLGDWTRKIRSDLKEGQAVKVRGPYGRFEMKRNKKQVWLAGGIGITPFLSNLRAMQEGDTREVALVYGVRNEKDALFIEEMRDKASTLANVQVFELFSDAGEFITVDKLQANLPYSVQDYDFYICGPKPMVDSIMKDLIAREVKRSQIHTEAFEFRNP